MRLAYAVDMSEAQNSSLTVRWRPLFLRDIEQRVEQQGLVGATHEVLQRDHVNVAIDGDRERLAAHRGGILLVGDHKNQWEFVAAMDTLHNIGRHDMHNVVKFYVQRQVEQLLGQAAAAHLLPVYPRVLARDRSQKINRELLNRIVYRNSLLSLAASEQANVATLSRATGILAQNGVVNIYPCGSIVDATKRPWRTGVGKIITGVPAAVWPDVLICPYRVPDIHRGRLVAAVALRGRGWAGRPQTLTMQFGRVQSMAELLEPLSSEERQDSALITEMLREQFIDYFADN